MMAVCQTRGKLVINGSLLICLAKAQITDPDPKANPLAKINHFNVFPHTWESVYHRYLTYKI